METVQFALLRGICQLPAYVAIDTGLLEAEGVRARASVAPTAWAVPERLAREEVQFAVIPWTRVAADRGRGNRLVAVAGSGIEEAALVVRKGVAECDVRSLAVPQEGGIKDLTAMALLASLGWTDVAQVRMPSGDGAVLSFVGEGADAASMVEPYATMLVRLGLGRVVRRTGDIWPGAPGCSLATTAGLIARRPDLVDAVVRAHLRAARAVAADPDEAARIGGRWIGVSPAVVREALESNRPDPFALRNGDAMRRVLGLMIERGYVPAEPTGYLDLSFLARAERAVAGDTAAP